MTATLIFCLITFISNGQVIQVHQGHCKKSEIKILFGDSIPAGFAIMQMGTFLKADVEGTIEGLTKKQIKTLKTYVYWRQCCDVFIAFNPIQTFEGYDPGPEYYKDKLAFYVLAPMWEIETIK